MKTVVHVEGFEKRALKLLGEDATADFIVYLSQHYADGAVIAGTGGFRKLRWARQHEGKSGGFRVIYFVTVHAVYPVMIYAKNEASNISQAHKNALREAAKTFKGE